MISTAKEIDHAVAVLKAGGLVAFPTETVYGLGASARNEDALSRIFTVKNRPTNNPLIVHLADKEEMEKWASDISKLAWRLADRFWPGPLTMILRKNANVSKTVTGGLETIALRVPNQPIALALLRVFGDGIAAPSANKFGRTSPTTAEHVREDLGDTIDFILDGGTCEVGIESTILDLSTHEPALLRPGGLTKEEIESCLGSSVPFRYSNEIRCPGQYPRHYAPQARVVLANAENFKETINEFLSQGLRVGVLALPEHQAPPPKVAWIPVSQKVGAFAISLYAALRELDRRNLDIIVSALPLEEGIGLAVADRLRRAAGKGNIIKGEKVA